MAVRGTSAQES